MSLFGFLIFNFLLVIIFDIDKLGLNKFDTYHRITIIIISFLGLIFTLLVIPICSYLEKKLKD
jgi:predicted ferric reductase